MMRTDCPFCGGNAVEVNDYNHLTHIECDDCLASTAPTGDRQEAIYEWNRRYDED